MLSIVGSGPSLLGGTVVGVWGLQGCSFLHVSAGHPQWQVLRVDKAPVQVLPSHHLNLLAELSPLPP